MQINNTVEVEGPPLHKTTLNVGEVHNTHLLCGAIVVALAALTVSV